MTKLNRKKVELPPILLRTETQRHLAQQRLANLPLDPENPVEIVMREQVKKRKLSLNAAMWAGPLRDIERDGWFRGRQYSAEVWHCHFKEAYLPDENDPDFDPSHVVEGYHKWDTSPWTGDRVLVGSTTQLTDAGMHVYLLQMEAEGALYGVTFTTREENYGRTA